MRCTSHVDLLQMVQEFLKPVVVDEDAMAFSAMQEVGPGGRQHFVAHRRAVHRQARGEIHQLQIALHRQRRTQVQPLGQKAQGARAPAVALVGRHDAQRLPGHRHVARRGRQQPGSQGQPGRLAAARATAQQQRAPLRQGDVGKGQRLPGGKPASQAAGLDQARGS